MTEKEKMIARAFPASDAQLCRPETVRNGHGLPNQGRVRLKRLVQLKKETQKIRIGTLNAGTMNGKSREIVDLMSRRKVNILCIQETRWKGNKEKELAERHKLIYSGTDEKGRNGVGVIIDKELKGGIYESNRWSEFKWACREKAVWRKKTIECWKEEWGGRENHGTCGGV
ncbi:hypothetical protein J437_LFUL008975 [Ladona fulva]|uniref:Endonuclease-reverse transcriptase n=1 Tax=Ladona fulva TaxID=123851 RepID=A0A8K0K515_LADFU|nr:hypothetical protein J437_LFUL008975 [Ladona fulva]